VFFDSNGRGCVPVGAQADNLEIVTDVKDGVSRAQKFFEQLWRYDQVVFDTSQSKS